MSESENTVARFERVSFRDEYGLLQNLDGVNFCVEPSDLAVVVLEPYNLSMPICELAQGLVFPDAGDVLFMNRSWREMSDFDSSSMRGSIGQVFREGGWVSNLTICDNILLAGLYHSNVTESDIMKRGVNLASQLGMSGLPLLRPDLVRSVERKKYQWVRAFVGRPRLILLECPEAGVRGSDVDSLFSLVDAAREGGCAVVWVTVDESVFSGKDIEISKSYKMNDSEMTLMVEDKDA